MTPVCQRARAAGGGDAQAAPAHSDASQANTSPACLAVSCLGGLAGTETSRKRHAALPPPSRAWPATRRLADLTIASPLASCLDCVDAPCAGATTGSRRSLQQAVQQGGPNLPKQEEQQQRATALRKAPVQAGAVPRVAAKAHRKACAAAPMVMMGTRRAAWRPPSLECAPVREALVGRLRTTACSPRAPPPPAPPLKQ